MTKKKYTLGLDLGITSVGFALVDTDQKSIIKAGVHLFETAENPKNGASLAAPRREARSTRRRLARRRMRLNAVLRTLKKFGFQDVDRITETPSQQRLNYNPWQLRSEGLNRQLTDLEFGIAVYHLAKHRGFKSSRLDTLNEDDNKKVGQMISGIQQLKNEFDSDAQTIGQFLYRKLKNLGRVRNKGGDFDYTPLRDWTRDELKRLCDNQIKREHAKVTFELYKKLDEIIFFQRPLKSIAAKIGKCDFFEDEKRAVKNAFSAELFVFWDKVNKLRIGTKIQDRPLSSDERALVFEKTLDVEKLTFKQLRKVLKIDQSFAINLQRPDDKDTKTIFEFKGYHTLRKTVETVDRNVWQSMKEDHKLLDHIASTLSIHFDEKEIEEELRKHPSLTGAEPKLISNLCEITSFKGTMSLSLKAIDILMTYMKEGMSYCDAVKRAQAEGKIPLKTVKKDNPTNNPVVDRALSQAIKVVNAIIKKYNNEYGSTECIRIELARDVGKSRKERKQIEKQNKENEERNNKAKEALNKIGLSQSKDMVEKYKLWIEQDKSCPYSGKNISDSDFKNDKVQVDHIIPFSRSFDDSFQNKVLVYTEENQKKGDRTPREWLSVKEKWEEFEDRAKQMYSGNNWKKLKNLLIQTVEQDFKDRNINDTRWISLRFKDLIKEKLDDVKRVECTKGGITFTLRRQWLTDQKKDRAHHVHHAEDAVLIALSSASIIQKLTKDVQRKVVYQENYHAPRTLELPWETFSEDVNQAISNIQISRMPNRKYSGTATKETIMSYRGKPIDTSHLRVYNDKTVGVRGQEVTNVVKRIKLEDVTLKNLEKMVDLHRNQTLYQILKRRLEDHNDDSKKAFAEPVYMYRKEGTQGPKVRGIRIYDDSVALVPVQKGVANNGDMIRIDIFKSPRGFVVSPIYVMDVLNKLLPATYVEKSKDLDLDPVWQFQCTLQKNDYVELISTNKKSNESTTTQGFYLGFDRSNGSIKIQDVIEETLNLKTGEVSTLRFKEKRLGIKRLDDIRKYNISLLGEKHLVRKNNRTPINPVKQKS